MDSGRSLVTKIVDEGRLNEVLRSGIASSFLDDEAGSIFNYVQRHYSEYKKVPARDTVLRAFPNFTFSSPQEPLEYYIHATKENYRRTVLEDGLNNLADIYAKDTKKSEELLRETLTNLNVTAKNFKDVNAAATAVDRIQWYRNRRDNPGVDGITSGWPTLDSQTLGWHGGEFVVLAAEKYMGKSWTMIDKALTAARQGEKVLFITKEMTQEAVTRRFDSIYARVEYDALRKGELTQIEEERYIEAMNELSNSNLQFVVARQGVNTVEDIQIKAVETDATIVFADSVYLFDPNSRDRYSGEPSRRMAVSQRCKSVAQELGIPVVVSVQAGRKKTKERTPDLDTIEWSNAFAQDADTVFFLERDDLDRDLRRSHIYLLKSREGQPDDFFIHADFQTMDFSERAGETSKPKTDVFDEEEETVWDE